MMENDKLLYDLKTGERIHRNLSYGLIIKNIKNGRLSPQHKLSHAGTDNWVALGNIPELKSHFGSMEIVAQPVAVLYDVEQDGKTLSGVSRGKLLEMIRGGGLQEVSRIRLQDAE